MATTLVTFSSRLTEATRKLHEQLADLEFPEIGALGLPVVDGKPSYDCDPDDIRVCHRPISIEIMMQELEGTNPGARIKPRTTFSTARSFPRTNSTHPPTLDSTLRGGGARATLYARHHFRRFVLNTWINSAADKGPFVLMHGDMLMLMSNLLVDEELTLIGVLDWEWS
ncbi:hypothetical protein TOPH_02806 [Tolypocladium ophioglossoides CBS 100239]|uniref:Uncharacterized protein n=1 Tax=Tolypocladium ophioglossoides (strain CBS 100239) TaxID=1163406 RepID=A0A0L0NF76_TOLOC|nr:hypothetical protein TOPH_02806 [Tolypocladium ophioglossoides CBS 100239]